MSEVEADPGLVEWLKVTGIKYGDKVKLLVSLPSSDDADRDPTEWAGVRGDSFRLGPDELPAGTVLYAGGYDYLHLDVKKSGSFWLKPGREDDPHYGLIPRTVPHVIMCSSRQLTGEYDDEDWILVPYHAVIKIE